jgi:hypothetical protein
VKQYGEKEPYEQGTGRMPLEVEGGRDSRFLV